MAMNNHPCRFLGIFPIGNSHPLHLPVRDLEDSLSYYEQSLGFNILSRQDTPYKQVLLQRDQVTMGLEENGGNPEEHSCYLSVSMVDALLQELQNRQLDVSPMRLDVNAGQTYRVFFLRAPDGLCFCFGQKQETSEKA
jgi:lactoylglutathione lyase